MRHRPVFSFTPYISGPNFPVDKQVHTFSMGEMIWIERELEEIWMIIIYGYSLHHTLIYPAPFPDLCSFFFQNQISSHQSFHSGNN